MQLAVRITSYALGGLMLLGGLSLIGDNEMDGATLVAFVLIVAQCTLSIIYTYKK